MNWGDAPFEQSLDEFLADWRHATSDREWCPPSGSSSAAAAARMASVLEDLLGRSWQRSLVVTHGGATVDLLRDLIGDDDLEALAPTALDQGIVSCGLTRLRYDSRWTVDCVGASTL